MTGTQCGSRGKKRRDRQVVEHPHAPRRARTHSGPVLLVDDDFEYRVAVRRTLESLGFDVIEADNGKVALDYLLNAELQPALVLLDLRMPVMSGWDLLKVLRSYLRLSQIPIVLTSGAEAEEVRRAGEQDHFLEKPYDVTALRTTVQRFVRPNVH